jgi:peptidyl-prolyl cis-trans isomerase D
MKKKIYTQKEKKDFYIKYKNIFSLPEKYDIEYLVYNKKILREQLSFSNDNLENYYKENQFKYIIPEKRKISQIFLSNIKSSKISNGELIKEILEKLKQGESFESLVVKYSDDKLSNKKQGNIGWISRNELTEEINNAAFNINKVNSISNIVETSQGFYILKLSDIKDAKIPNFNDIENIVKIDYENSQIQNRYETIFEDVSNLLYENPNSLDKVEDYLSVKKVSTNLILFHYLKFYVLF